MLQYIILIFAAICLCTILILYYLPLSKKNIAIVQFDNRQFDPQIERRIWEFADWYEFAETADKEFEINDLKEFYEIVLELR